MIKIGGAAFLKCFSILKTTNWITVFISNSLKEFFGMRLGRPVPGVKTSIQKGEKVTNCVTCPLVVSIVRDTIACIRDNGNTHNNNIS